MKKNGSSTPIPPIPNLFFFFKTDFPALRFKVLSLVLNQVQISDS